ncbi:MAG: polysaccharide deacetylase family protein [Bacteroidia bacterium]|nr:polysaccharide deacetylase family protein [Bacteroidia bacterium]
MRTICLYFQVHQPNRIRRYRFFDIGNDHYYWDDYTNRSILRKVAEKCYLPANKVFLKLIKEWGRRFKISYSLSGAILEQFEMFAPDVLDSFKKLADTGCVEFLAETYAHSLVSMKCKIEFAEQVKQHSEKIEKLFGQKPKVFRNTELIYSDSIGEMVAEMGFNAMLTEGAKHILGWKSPNFLYCNAINPKLKVLLRNFRLSDDITFRFSNQAWSEWPLTADKLIGWINTFDPKENLINLFMDYETFGEHQWAETGIFNFIKSIPEKALANSITFSTPSEAAAHLDPVSAIHVPNPISWADEERDLTAWLGNELQDEAFSSLYALAPKVKKCNDPEIKRDYNYLQTSDHFYYMCTKWFSDGDVHKYFNPYNSPYEAYINYMNALSDFIDRLDKLCPDTDEKDHDVLPVKKTVHLPKKKAAVKAKKTSAKSTEKKTVKPIVPKSKVTATKTAKATPAKASHSKTKGDIKRKNKITLKKNIRHTEAKTKKNKASIHSAKTSPRKITKVVASKNIKARIKKSKVVAGKLKSKKPLFAKTLKPVSAKIKAKAKVKDVFPKKKINIVLPKIKPSQKKIVSKTRAGQIKVVALI